MEAARRRGSVRYSSQRRAQKFVVELNTRGGGGGGWLHRRKSVDRGSDARSVVEERVDGAPKKLARWRALGALEMEMESARRGVLVGVRGAAHAACGAYV